LRGFAPTTPVRLALTLTLALALALALALPLVIVALVERLRPDHPGKLIIVVINTN
jgi:hypothetical protein